MEASLGIVEVLLSLIRLKHVMSEELADAVCVQCGQCAAICPVGAIYEQDAIQPVWAALDDPTKHVVVQTAPARLTVRFDPCPGSSKDQVWECLSRHLRQRLSDQGVPFVEIVLDPEPPRPDPVSGKYRTVAVEMPES